jgi:hypothetical protein
MSHPTFPDSLCYRQAQQTFLEINNQQFRDIEIHGPCRSSGTLLDKG